ncbi:MAG: bifunctional aspartate kinase/diaminopimelate decarboxylase [Myxococcota bacterium]
MSDHRFAVLKFGGTSVSRPERWAVIRAQAQSQREEGRTPVLVCSAVAGVTDDLQTVIAQAGSGSDVDTPLARITERQAELARGLGVDLAVIADEMEELRRLALGAQLLGETSPAVQARILAKGERMSTRLGAAWLSAQGLPTRWVDARDLLQSDGRGPLARRMLAAHVPWDLAPALQRDLGGDAVIVTQGFVARDPDGATCVLGRGGSDTSATTLAAKLGAEVCEIWTDVPGMFTADPRKQPAARLLRALGYAEAQEIATTGAKVLHPRAIAPARAARIPISIRCTPQPDMAGTRIAADAPTGPAQVKALSRRRGLVLVSMETLGMWQEVGFLADAFGVFADHGLSIDTVSTSETNVTVTLDPHANAMDPTVLDAVLADLAPICTAKLVTQVASVSLVGRGIRSILHQLAPALEQFEDHRVHLVSQAASDLNLTFVVDESTADRLLAKLHAMLFAHRPIDAVIGRTWQELFATPSEAPETSPPWWASAASDLHAIAAAGTPVYVYDAATIDARAQALAQLTHVDQALYAVKANAHPEVIRRAAAAGLGFECVSPGEVEWVREHVGPDAIVLFTPNFAPREDYERGFAAHAHVTLDNLHPLEAWPDVFNDRDIFVRVDPGQGRGHHAKVRTAGARSKFGVAPDQLETFAKLADQAGCRIIGLHAHTGSGVLDPTAWQHTAVVLAQCASLFPLATILDVGGGLGVPDRPGRPPLDLDAVDLALASVRQAHPEWSIWIEPGRYLIAEAGVLLTRVTQRKQKGDLRYVGVDAGMHTLLRPALYGAHHHVANLTSPQAEPEIVTVVGPICETGDVLARDRLIAQSKEGDLLLLGTAGAYGAVMANDYNRRGRPREVVRLKNEMED